MPLAEPADELEALRPHNLMTYKSIRGSLNAWSIEELIGHYVNYRKAFAPDVPATDFGLYAISTRDPRKLLAGTTVEQIKPGVLRLTMLHRNLTIIVPRRIDPHPRNAIWELFSGDPQRFLNGTKRYHWRQTDPWPVLGALNEHYQQLGIPRVISNRAFLMWFLKKYS